MDLQTIGAKMNSSIFLQREPGQLKGHDVLSQELSFFLFGKINEFEIIDLVANQHNLRPFLGAIVDGLTGTVPTNFIATPLSFTLYYSILSNLADRLGQVIQSNITLPLYRGRLQPVDVPYAEELITLIKNLSELTDQVSLENFLQQELFPRMQFSHIWKKNEVEQTANYLWNKKPSLTIEKWVALVLHTYFLHPKFLLQS
jgi:hypothetical protein